MCQLQGFRMARALRIFQSEQHYPNLMRAEDVNHLGKKMFFCDSINTATTFTTEACQETFKIQSSLLISDFEKVLYLLKCKVCAKVPYIGKAKTKLRYRFNTYKSKHRAFRKDIQRVPKETALYSLLSRWPQQHQRSGFFNF